MKGKDSAHDLRAYYCFGFYYFKEIKKGVEYAGEHEHYYRFNVEVGTWTFKAMD